VRWTTIFENLAVNNQHSGISQIWSHGLRSFGSRFHCSPSTALKALAFGHRQGTMTVGSAVFFAPRGFGKLRLTADQCVGRGLQEQKDRQNDTNSTG
jgi:hypothetical protein